MSGAGWSSEGMRGLSSDLRGGGSGLVGATVSTMLGGEHGKERKRCGEGGHVPLNCLGGLGGR